MWSPQSWVSLRSSSATWYESVSRAYFERHVFTTVRGVSDFEGDRFAWAFLVDVEDKLILDGEGYQISKVNLSSYLIYFINDLLSKMSQTPISNFSQRKSSNVMVTSGSNIELPEYIQSSEPGSESEVQKAFIEIDSFLKEMNS